MGRFDGVFSTQDLNEHVDDYHKKVESMNGTKAEYLAMKSGDEALVRFLAKDPIKFWQHRVFDHTIKNGAGGFRVFSCIRTADCPLCKGGDKPVFKVAWQVLHLDNIGEGGTLTPKVKLWVQGIRFGELYEKKLSKYNPAECNSIIERIGVGNNTQYSMSKAENQTMPKWDGTQAVDLMEYFGVDDNKFKDMTRIGMSMSQSGVPAQSYSNNGGGDEGAAEQEYNGPKKGAKSLLEEDDDIPM